MAQAGHDPVDLLRSCGNRVQSLHVKDRKPNATVTFETGPDSAFFTEVGNGTLDWQAILRRASKNHVPDICVEQDQTDKAPLESLEISYDNLVKFLSKG
jgi:sugar phosphate isomerase/epimerase